MPSFTINVFATLLGTVIAGLILDYIRKWLNSFYNDDSK